MYEPTLDVCPMEGLIGEVRSMARKPNVLSPRPSGEQVENTSRNGDDKDVHLTLTLNNPELRRELDSMQKSLQNLTRRLEEKNAEIQKQNVVIENLRNEKHQLTTALAKALEEKELKSDSIPFAFGKFASTPATFEPVLEEHLPDNNNGSVILVDNPEIQDYGVGPSSIPGTSNQFQTEQQHVPTTNKRKKRKPQPVRKSPRKSKIMTTPSYKTKPKEAGGQGDIRTNGRNQRSSTKSAVVGKKVAQPVRKKKIKARVTKEKEYLVERILDVRLMQQDNQFTEEYYIKWLNYGDHENSWEPADLCSCDDRIADFYRTAEGKAKKKKFGEIMKSHGL